jgi:transposase
MLNAWHSGLTRAVSTPARLVRRAKIILLAADGKSNQQIAAETGVTPNGVGLWRRRFVEHRIPGIVKDAPGRGRPGTVLQAWSQRIIHATTQTTPAAATHSSVRALATHLGCDRNVVARVWKAANMQPHRVKTFKLSNGSQFTEKVVDVVSLYLDPPEQAMVLCVDEKSQIQALDRTQPCLPLGRDHTQTRTHDYVRNGTTTLFAALEVAQGKLIASQGRKRHGVDQWLEFLRRIDAATPPELDLHLIADHYHTHKNQERAGEAFGDQQRWLARHPRFLMHFIPTSSSWLNLVERWFAELETKRLWRRTFKNVRALIRAIEAYIEQRNDSPTTFTWTASAQSIHANVARARRVLDNHRSGCDGRPAGCRFGLAPASHAHRQPLHPDGHGHDHGAPRHDYDGELVRRRGDPGPLVRRDEPERGWQSGRLGPRPRRRARVRRRHGPGRLRSAPASAGAADPRGSHAHDHRLDQRPAVPLRRVVSVRPELCQRALKECQPCSNLLIECRRRP